MVFLMEKINGLFIQEYVVSDFVVANSLLRSDFCSFGEDYLLFANKEFINRVVKGIVAFRFGTRWGDKVWWDAEEGTKRLKELLPESLHDRIEPLRLEADWADQSNFR